MLKKLKETTIPVLILFLIVGLMFLCGFVPFDKNIFFNFLLCCVFLIIGQVVFLIGADKSIITIGKHSGVGLMKLKKLWLIVLFGAIFGLLTTLAEPDIQLLSKFLSAISQNTPKMLFMGAVGLGVSVFTALAYYRILKGFSLKYLLLIIYSCIFIMAIFSSNEFLSLSFDSSGITTGPITVPFLLSLTIGICSARAENKKEDNFGVVALASTGPIIAVLILSYIFPATPNNFLFSDNTLLNCILDNLLSVVIAFVPILIVFIFLQIIMFKFPKKQLIKIIFHLFFCAFGLVIFLTSAIYGFSPMGEYLGIQITQKWLLTVLALLFGLILVFTEPAIKILFEQVETITSGSIKSKYILWSLGISISLALLLSILRIFYDFSILYYLVPTIVLALGLTFLCPPLFYAIGFDSGGVISGTMLVAFVLPFFIGISNSLHNNSFDAFGTVALTSLFPIIAIEFLGIIYKLKVKKQETLEKQKKELEAKQKKEQLNLENEQKTQQELETQQKTLQKVFVENPEENIPESDILIKTKENENNQTINTKIEYQNLYDSILNNNKVDSSIDINKDLLPVENQSLTNENIISKQNIQKILQKSNKDDFYLNQDDKK